MLPFQEKMKKGQSSKDLAISTPDFGFFSGFTNAIQNINDSKIFAGIMILLLNISSKFVNIRLSKTVESYLKNSFSRQFLVFIIAWMGTREFWVALIISFVFTFCVDYLLNEESMFCILPESFTDYHVGLLNEEQSCKAFNEDDVKKAMDILKKARDILDSSVSTSTSEKKDIKHTDTRLNTKMISNMKPFLNQQNFMM
jgi:hypothetical protein